MHDPSTSIADPRSFPLASPASTVASTLHALAASSLAASTAQEADAHDAQVARTLQTLLDDGDGEALRHVLESSPSVDVYRLLWRALSRIAGSAHAVDATLAVTLFAIPIVIVAAASSEPVHVAGTLHDVDAIVAILREHDALRGNQAFGLSNALTTAEAIDVARLPALLRAARSGVAIDVAPEAIEVMPGERAYLRFIVGSALAAPGVDLLRDTDASRFGLPLARRLIAQLASPGVSLVALPRAPLALPAAVVQGRAAQREVSAQLFASNALRELRAAFGEPVAVLSAHRCADATGGGELRLSLSSPLSPRDAQGFRCPLQPGERASDVATMLLDLMRDCRVTDVRVVPGVHPDRDATTGVRLLFKPDTMPPQARLH